MSESSQPATVGVQRRVRPGAEALKLSDSRIAEIAFAVLRAHNDDRLWRALTYSSGPYDVTMPTLALCHLARVFFAVGMTAASEPCEHRWKVTQQGVTYQDQRCELCGETKRETWD